MVGSTIPNAPHPPDDVTSCSINVSHDLGFPQLCPPKMFRFSVIIWDIGFIFKLCTRKLQFFAPKIVFESALTVYVPLIFKVKEGFKHRGSL